jgi:hypothetical protein
MSTSKVTIRFTSLTNLWAFRLAIQANEFKMNLAELTIICECSKEQIKLAQNRYHGQIAERVQQQP